MTLTWRAADGTETDLDDRTADFFVVAGPVGLDAPTPVNRVEDFLSFDGGTLSQRRRAVRQVVLPFLVTHATRVQTAVARLVRLLQGPGELVFSDGTTSRYLRNVIYEAGLGGDLSTFSLEGDRRVVASLLALDPWWYGQAEIHALSLGASVAFDAPIPFDASLPFNGGSSESVVVDGDASVFPVITVYGPATEVVLSSAGLSWETVVELDESDVLVVDTRPGSRGPRLNGGAVDWSLLTAASRLWTLEPGSQTVQVNVVGEGATTAAQIEFAPRYLTP